MGFGTGGGGAGGVEVADKPRGRWMMDDDWACEQQHGTSGSVGNTTDQVGDEVCVRQSQCRWSPRARGPPSPDPSIHPSVRYGQRPWSVVAWVSVVFLCAGPVPVCESVCLAAGVSILALFCNTDTLPNYICPRFHDSSATHFSSPPSRLVPPCFPCLRRTLPRLASPCYLPCLAFCFAVPCVALLRTCLPALPR